MTNQIHAYLVSDMNNGFPLLKMSIETHKKTRMHILLKYDISKSDYILFLIKRNHEKVR